MSRSSNLAFLALAITAASCSGSSTPDNNPGGGTLRIASFEAADEEVAKGAPVILSWKVSGVAGATIDIRATPGGSILDHGTELEGTLETPPIQETTRFDLTATSGGKSTSKSLMVIVSESAVSILSFSATPNPGTLHGTTTLSWSIAGAADVRLMQGSTELFSSSTMVASGLFSATLHSELNAFKLIASNGARTDERDLTVAAMGMTGTTITETEPNDDIATADVLGRVGDAVGAIMPAEDLDVFSVEVAEGGSLYAITACNFDSVVRLLGPDGAELGSADEGGEGNCTEIDPAIYDFATNLTAGTYYLEVSSYVGTSTGTYTLSVVASGPGCGNRVIEAGEQCDDGNTTSGDRCSATCQVELAGSISGTGGSVTVNLGAYPDAAVISVEITQPGQSIEASTGTGCGMDTVLSLIKDGSYLGWSTDGSDACASIPFPSTYAADLEPGMYMLEVGNEGATSGMATVAVTIHSPACGNGARESRAGEQCDDGNMIDGDGCSNMCAAQAVGSVMGPPGERSFMGSLPIAGEALYEVTMTSMGYIAAETFLPAIGECSGEAADTELAILDSNLVELGTDSDDGVEYCAKIDPAVDMFALVGPGTYFVRVRQWDQTIATPQFGVLIRALAAGCGNGVLESGESCDDGNTAAGDGCTAQCRLDGSIVEESMGNDASSSATDTRAMVNQTATMHGAIDPIADVDWYRIDVPAGAAATIVANTYSTVGQSSACTNATTDTKLFLLNADGSERTNNDDHDGQYCSRIDGATDMAAANLAPGRYYLRVEHYAGSALIPSYFLDVRITR